MLINPFIFSSAEPVSAAFTFSVDTTKSGSASNGFQLPLISSGAISIDVDWGDGNTDTITSYNQAETLHTYATSGIYTISITNEVRGWKFNNGGDKKKILDISKWGEFNFTEYAAFSMCSNLTSSATDFPTISTTNLQETFRQCGSFNGDLTGWDVSNVTNLFFFSFLNSNFQGNGLSTWNTSSLANFNGAFYNNSSLIADLSGWNFTAATNVAQMFQSCSSFNPNVSTWTFTSLTNFNSMFNGCSSFTGVGIENWDVSGVSTFAGLFNGCSSFNKDISGWNMSSATSLSTMFQNATSFDQDLSSWDINQVSWFTNFMKYITLSTANYDALLIGWEAQAPNTGKSISFGSSQYTLGGAAAAARASLISTYGWTITDGGAVPLPAFTFSVNTANAGSASNQFQLPLVSSGAISMDVDWGDGTTDTITAYNQAETLHTYASSGIYTITITNEVRGWKFAWGGDYRKILDVSNWGEFNFTNENSFRGCPNLTCSATDAPIVSSADMTSTFQSCVSLTNIGGDWDISGVTNLYLCFRDCIVFNGSSVANWDTGLVTNMYGVFYNCVSFNQDIGGWNTSSVTDMGYIIRNWPTGAFNQDISSWDIDLVTNMSFFLVGHTLSTANYDALLVSWEAQAPTSGVSPNFGYSKYTLGSAAATARASLISVYGWTITDGGGI